VAFYRIGQSRARRPLERDHSPRLLAELRSVVGGAPKGRARLLFDPDRVAMEDAAGAAA
jgi:hypothetical protein